MIAARTAAKTEDARVCLPDPVVRRDFANFGNSGNPVSSGIIDFLASPSLFIKAKWSVCGLSSWKRLLG